MGCRINMKQLHIQVMLFIYLSYWNYIENNFGMRIAYLRLKIVDGITATQNTNKSGIWPS